MNNLQEIQQENSTNEASIAYGDRFLLGEHTLLCADSRDTELLNTFLKGKRIELLLTDPPYGIDYVASKAGFNESTKEHEDIANDGFQSDEEYARFTE